MTTRIPAVASAGGDATSYCATHPTVETHMRCNRCGRLICLKRGVVAGPVLGVVVVMALDVLFVGIGLAGNLPLLVFSALTITTIYPLLK